MVTSDRPYIFFDTSFVSGVLAKLADGQRRRLNDHVWWECRYAISPMTMIELARGLHNGDDAHWDQNRRRFAVLEEPDKYGLVLRLPQQHLAESLFGLRIELSGYEPWITRLWFEQIAGGRTRQELRDGVFSPTRGEVLPFDMTIIEREYERTKETFMTGMERNQERVRSSGCGWRFVFPEAPWLDEDSDNGMSSPRAWTGALLKHCDVPVTPENIERAQVAVDAAYRYQRHIYELTRGGYKFERDFSAWADGQQLLYLCDVRLHLVTDDGDHIVRTEGTTQRRQILTTAEFLAMAGI